MNLELIRFHSLFTGSPSPSPSSRGAHCPSAVGSPRKEVVCYFQGKRAASTVDACLCTHIVYTDVGLDSESRLSIADGKTEII